MVCIACAVPRKHMAFAVDLPFQRDDAVAWDELHLVATHQQG